MSCSLVKWYQHCGGTYHLKLKATRGTLQEKAADLFETLPPFYHPIWHHIPVTMDVCNMVCVEFHFLDVFEHLLANENYMQ
jgi:hypothetical protein